MAVSVIQTAVASGAGTLAVSFSATKQSNLVVLFIHKTNNVDTITGVNDTAGNTYALDTLSGTNSVGQTYIYSGVQSTLGATAGTVQTSANHNLRIEMFEIGG